MARATIARSATSLTSHPSPTVGGETPEKSRTSGPHGTVFWVQFCRGRGEKLDASNLPPGRWPAVRLPRVAERRRYSSCLGPRELEVPEKRSPMSKLSK